MTLLGGRTEVQSSIKLQEFSFLEVILAVSSESKASVEVSAYLEG